MEFLPQLGGHRAGIRTQSIPDHTHIFRIVAVSSDSTSGGTCVSSVATKARRAWSCFFRSSIGLGIFLGSPLVQAVPRPGQVTLEIRGHFQDFVFTGRRQTADQFRGLESRGGFATSPGQHGNQQRPGPRSTSGSTGPPPPSFAVAARSNRDGGYDPSIEVLPPGRKLLILGLGIPERRAFRQSQFRSPSSRFPLLPRQPPTQGWNQVVVRQLVVAGTGITAGVALTFPRDRSV